MSSLMVSSQQQREHYLLLELLFASRTRPQIGVSFALAPLSQPRVLLCCAGISTAQMLPDDLRTRFGTSITATDEIKPPFQASPQVLAGGALCH